MSDINVSAFGSERTRRWAENILKSKNDYANKGFQKAGSPAERGKAEHTQHKREIRDNAPSKSGRTTMNKTVGTLGSGNWSSVG